MRIKGIDFCGKVGKVVIIFIFEDIVFLLFEFKIKIRVGGVISVLVDWIIFFCETSTTIFAKLLILLFVVFYIIVGKTIVINIIIWVEISILNLHVIVV